MEKHFFVLCIFFSLLTGILCAQGSNFVPAPQSQTQGQQPSQSGQPSQPTKPSNPQGEQNQYSEKTPNPSDVQNNANANSYSYTQNQSSDAYLYHGKRIYASHEPFCVVLVKSTKSELQIMFNLPIDPRTFTHESIFVNGKPLDLRTKIAFSKNAKTLVISYAIPKKQECTLSFKDVRACDGSYLDKEEFTNLIQGKTVSYPVK